MPASPVRLAIASSDQAVTMGLRRMLAEQEHRVVVVDDAGPVDVVLHHGDGPDGEAVEEVLQRTGASAWVPLRVGVEQIVSLVEAAVATPPFTDAEPHGLSAREVQVLTLIAEGLTNQEIADRVYISINSVKTYVRSAYRKVGVNSRSQAAVWGLENGLVRRRG